MASGADGAGVEDTLPAAQVDLVRDSLRRLLPHAEQLGEVFYDELFRRAPEVRKMFPENIGEQRAKLVATLATAVKHLDDLPSIEDEIARLGRLHAVRGIGADGYELVGSVLLDVLERLSDEFDEPTRAAWASTYATLSGAMMAAADAG